MRFIPGAEGIFAFRAGRRDLQQQQPIMNTGNSRRPEDPEPFLGTLRWVEERVTNRTLLSAIELRKPAREVRNGSEVGDNVNNLASSSGQQSATSSKRINFSLVSQDGW